MKILKISGFIAFLFILAFQGISAAALVEDSPEQLTIFDGITGEISGPPSEIAILESFPYHQYQSYHVSGLGKLYLDEPTDILKDKLKAGIPWQTPITDLLKRFIKPGMVVVDIGSHIGLHSLTMSRLVGPEGHVHAFEPQMKLFAEFIMNMKLNDCRNITAIRSALGSNFEEIRMGAPSAGNEASTIIGSDYGGDFTIVFPLDALNLDKVSFMKVTAENYEYEVISGAITTIEKFKPIIILEIMGNLQHAPSNRAEMIQKTIKKIKGFGYVIYCLENNRYLALPK